MVQHLDLVQVPAKREKKMSAVSSQIDLILTKFPLPLTSTDRKTLLDYTISLPLYQGGLVDLNSVAVFEEHLERWSAYLAWLRAQRSYAPLDIFSPSTLWGFSFALAVFLGAQRGRVFAISGPPGVGKSTLTTVLVDCLTVIRPDRRYVKVSLDDFYLPKEDRVKAGFKWRAVPGTHDIDAAVRFLTAVQKCEEEGEMPRFSHARDDRETIETVSCSDVHVIFDGWFLGMRAQGYERVAALIDVNCFVDCPVQLAKKRRFAREEHIRRSEATSGFSVEETTAFWDTVLHPGIELWVNPIKRTADVVIEFGADGSLIKATRKSNHSGDH